MASSGADTYGVHSNVPDIIQPILLDSTRKQLNVHLSASTAFHVYYLLFKPFETAPNCDSTQEKRLLFPCPLSFLHVLGRVSIIVDRGVQTRDIQIKVVEYIKYV